MRTLLRKISAKVIVFILLGVLLVIAYGFRLQFPAEPYFDEVHYVRFIRGLLYSNEYLATSNVHPPLWHLLTAGAMTVMGDSAAAWRIVSLIAGILLFVPLYAVAKKLTGNSAAAFLSVFLLAFDCLSLTQARIAMMNSVMVLFMLWAVYYFLDAFADAVEVKRKAFRLCGVFLGLAVSTKLVPLNLYFFFVPVLIWEFSRRPRERGPLLKEGLLSFVALPLVIFAGVHLVLPLLTHQSLKDLWDVWKFHMNYNMTTDQTHPYASRWWAWVLLLRPIWFYFDQLNWGTPQEAVSGIIAIGNPAIFWMIPAAVYNLLINFLFKKSRAGGLLLLGLFTQWLSFALVQRLQFFHYFYSVMPFVAISLAVLMKQLWDWGGFWRFVVVIYLLTVAGLFVYWYPLLIGSPVSSGFYRHHIWFKSWI